MAVTSFEVDERTAALLAQLQETFGVKTNAAVLRKALALANVASQYADDRPHDHHHPARREAGREGLACRVIVRRSRSRAG